MKKRRGDRQGGGDNDDGGDEEIVHERLLCMHWSLDSLKNIEEMCRKITDVGWELST